MDHFAQMHQDRLREWLCFCNVGVKALVSLRHSANILAIAKEARKKKGVAKPRLSHD
jgi:hypothetical protein